MNTSIGPQLASAALRNAFPYLRLYQGKTFVIKAGGEAFVDAVESRALLEQVSILHRLGIHVVLVHGGGPQISDLSRRLDVDPQFVDGRRVTSPEALEATVMALCGTINKKLVAQFRELESPAVGISGIDGRLVTVKRRPVGTQADGTPLDYGCVGDIEAIDPRFLNELLSGGYLPVVSPVCASDSGEILNVNADSIASRLAVALKAEKLVFLTGAPGVLRDPDDPSSLISYTDVEELSRLQESGSLREGMLPKIASLRLAVEQGVPRVHVISHRVPDTLLIEVFTNEGAGTLVVPDTRRMTAEEKA